MKRRTRSFFLALSALSVTLPAGLAHQAAAHSLMALEAGWSETDQGLLLLQEVPVTEDVLEDSRGGFTLAGNVTIDIGFESMVMIDGVLQAHTRLTLDGLLSGSFSAENVQSSRTALPDGALVTVPSDALITVPNHAMAVSRIALDELGLPLRTLIQNNQDNRMIQSLQVLNIEFGNMGNGSFGPLQQLMNLQATESVR